MEKKNKLINASSSLDFKSNSLGAKRGTVNERPRYDKISFTGAINMRKKKRKMAPVPDLQ